MNTAAMASIGHEDDDLTPRMRQVVALVGGERLSYDAAARRMGISRRTVEQYAAKIRNRVGSDRPPREALIDCFHEDPAAFEAA